MTTTYTPIGYGITDENGIAKLDHDMNGDSLTHSYTGTGAGKVDIVASLDSEIDESSLVSETYELIDAIMYDMATTGNKNNSWWNYGNRLTLTTDNDGTVLSNNGSSNGFYYAYPNGTTVTSDTNSYVYNEIAFEFDIIDYNANTDGGLIFYDGTKQLYVNFEWLGVSTGDTVYLQYTNSVFTAKVNGVKKWDYTFALSTPFRAGLLVQPTKSIKYKNFKILPV
jgi:hypothetical protein